MDQWWNRPAPGEGERFEIDPETGIGGWRYHEHLWLAPFRGLADLASDIRNGRMTTWDWVFVIVVLLILILGR
jgi:hypothetical protein